MNFYIGQVFLFAGNFAPRGWAFCNGQLLAISTNQALFAILGTTYGGNGIQTFALPDLRGRTLVSVGQGPGRSNYVLGQAGGSETVSLLSTQLPQHLHVTTVQTATVNVSQAAADVTTPAGAVPTQYDTAPLYAANPDGSSTLGGVTATPTIGAVGSGSPVPTLMPYLTLNYCICIQGLFPSRN